MVFMRKGRTVITYFTDKLIVEWKNIRLVISILTNKPFNIFSWIKILSLKELESWLFILYFHFPITQIIQAQQNFPTFLKIYASSRFQRCRVHIQRHLVFWEIFPKDENYYNLLRQLFIFFHTYFHSLYLVPLNVKLI